MNFSFTKEQEESFKDWKIEHDEHCKFAHGRDGAIGGRLTISVTPTGLGNVVKVKCACNSDDSEIDLTDYEGW